MQISKVSFAREALYIPKASDWAAKNYVVLINPLNFTIIHSLNFRVTPIVFLVIEAISLHYNYFENWHVIMKIRKILCANYYTNKITK